jgi:shikimate kinase
MNIYLTGYRGTGKSTVAALVAGQLGWAWLDTDELVEGEAGMSIAEIFSSQGEAGFREREYQVLCQCARLDAHVVALGGGAVIPEANRELLRGGGPMVWLTATPETILERLEADPATASRRPPLVAGGGRKEVERLLSERSPVYQDCADLVVPTDQKTPQQVAEEIVAWFGSQAHGGDRR